MEPVRRSLIACLLLLTMVAFRPGPVRAAYPDRPIHLIVPFSPGGGVDVISRLLAHRLSERLNQTVLVENRPGGGANIANQYVAHAAADGYTLLMFSPAAAINASLYKSLGYNLKTDFVPVASVLSGALLLVVAADSPLHSVHDLIATARAKPGEMNFASAGIGSTEHLAGELLAQMSEIKVVHVPYKGTGLALNDLLAGQVQFLFGGSAGLVPQVQAGQLRALAQTGIQLQPELSDIPTMDQAGVPGYDVSTQIGVLAPKGTAPDIVTRLNTEISASARDLDARFRPLGGQAVTMTSQEFGAMIADQIEKWSVVIEKARIHVD
jgi:tripartite-type tricarboxylate transporter receptor subunit TctC